jgi:hypothetical protein
MAAATSLVSLLSLPRTRSVSVILLDEATTVLA